jgi:WD40 repeat protein
MRHWTMTGSLAGCLGVAALLPLLICVCATPQPEAYRLFSLGLNELNFGVQAATFTPGGQGIALVGKRVTAPGVKVYAENLELWDFRNKQLLFHENLTTGDDAGLPKSLTYIDDGKRLLYCDGLDIRVLETAHFHEIARFPVGWMIERPSKRVVVIESAVSNDGREFAALLGWETGKVGYTNELTHFAVRIYDMDSGKVMREQTLTFERPAVIPGFAMSQDGTKVAWTVWQPEREIQPDTRNLYILDVATGQSADISTGRPEGEVAFAAKDRLLSISFNPALTEFQNDGINVWNTVTAKLSGLIPSTPNGVHHRLAVSSDGRIGLGYVGRDKSNENFIDFDKQQFRLWELNTGNVLFTSPLIEPVIQDDFGPMFQLSPDGHLVLVSWPNRDAPVLVYELLSSN